MTTTIKQTPESAKTSVHEDILVIKRDVLFQNESAWNGLKQVKFDDYLSLIQEHKEFLPRPLMEDDPQYKQIIPYLVFEHDNHFFMMQRRSNASEQRLQNKYSLGIGGHIRKEDMQTNSLFDWAHREFYEEIHYQGTFTIEPIGILNDDTNAVGQVHIAFVFLLHGDSSVITIKDEHKNGQLVMLEDLPVYYSMMESWSQHVLTFLKQRET